MWTGARVRGVSVALGTVQLERLRVAQARRRLSRSEILRAALEDWLRRFEHNEPDEAA
jgi:hypothetical protein